MTRVCFFVHLWTGRCRERQREHRAAGWNQLKTLSASKGFSEFDSTSGRTDDLNVDFSVSALSVFLYHVLISQEEIKMISSA